MHPPYAPSPSCLPDLPQGAASVSDSLAVAQFNALRAELVSLRENMMRLALLSIAGFPTLLTLADGWSRAPGQSLAILVICASPVMVSLCALLLCSLHFGVMRIGGFIRTEIEARIMKHSGWEEYLDGTPGRRLPEKCFLTVMMVVYITYFGVAFMLADASAPQQFGNALRVVYGLAFVVSAIACSVSFRFGGDAQRDIGPRAGRSTGLSASSSSAHSTR